MDSKLLSRSSTCQALNPEESETEQANLLKIKDYRARAQLLTREFGNMEDSLEEREQMLDDLRQQVQCTTEYKQHYRAVVLECEQLYTQMRQLQLEFERQLRQNREQGKQVLAREKDAKETALAGLNEDVDKLKVRLEELRCGVSDAQKDCISAQAGFKEKMTQYKAKWKLMKEQLKYFYEENGTLRARSEQLKQACQRIKDERLVLQEQANRAKDQQQSLQLEAEQLSYELMARNAREKEESLRLQEELAETMRLTAKLRQQSSRLAIENAQLKRRVKAQTESGKLLIGQQDNLENNLLVANTEIERASRQLKREQMECEELQGRILELEHSYRGVDTKAKELLSQSMECKAIGQRRREQRREIMSASDRELQLIENAFRKTAAVVSRMTSGSLNEL